MRLISTTTALTFVLALSPLRAQETAVTAPDACAKLVAQALALTGEKILCAAVPAGLTLQNVSDAGLKRLNKDAIKDGRYLGFAIVPASSSAPVKLVAETPKLTKEQAARLEAAQARVAALSSVKLDDRGARADLDVFSPAAADSAVVGRERVTDSVADVRLHTLASTGAEGKLVLTQGPPGSGGDRRPSGGPPGAGGPPGSGDDDQQQDPPRRGGPPGSGNQQPPRTGPPGSGNPPGGQVPPNGGSTPPSRPAPVWRSNIPAPAPNWWNTDFNAYNWWNGLPQGYDRPYSDTSNPDTFYYYSRWYRWSSYFVTNWERTEDSATLVRTAANQGQVQTRALTSQSYRDVKECWYQAIYRYDWVQGGFYGSHWEENFDHYKASCVREPREYGTPRTFTTSVSFDMSQAQGQDLPWEKDVVVIRYDGQGTPRYDFSGASYNYSIRTDNQRPGAESLTFLAGPKILRAPEADKVQAFLRLNAGKVELVINDDRASFYQGETLRVNARVVRRVVYKVKGVLWGWNEKYSDSVIVGAPIDVVVDANNPQSVTDLTAAANGPKPANFVRSSVLIESWEFSRVNSRISNNAVIRKGQGNSVAN